MANFWNVNETLPIAQRSVAIPSENGLEYGERQKIVIRVDPSVEFFLPSESYVQFRLKLELPAGSAKTRLQLNDRIGGHSVINHVRILSGTGILLEEIQNYNVLAYLMYSYDTNDTKRRKRALTERSTMYNPACASTHGGEQRDNNSCVDNPYFQNGKDLEFVYVKVCLPLVASGLFKNPKVFPTMLTQGLRLEITLEDAEKCVQRLCTTAPAFEGNVDSGTATGTEFLPRLSHVNAGAEDSGLQKAATDLTPTAINVGNPTRLTFANDELSQSIANGTSINFTGNFSGGDAYGINGTTKYMKNDATQPGRFFLYDNAALDKAFNTDGDTISVTAGTAGSVSVFPSVSSLVLKTDNNVSSVDTCPFVVGESIALGNHDAASGVDNVQELGSITNIAAAGGTVSLTIAAKRLPNDAQDYNPASDPVFVFSRTCRDAAFKPSYKVDQVELVMKQVIMPKGYTSSMMRSMKQNGMLRYDFVSYMNYKHSMVSTDTEATVQLPLQNSRAKAVLMLPLQSKHLSAGKRVEDDDASAFRGILDDIEEYRFNIDQKLNPDRPVPLQLLSAGSIEQQYLVELEKSLGQAGIQPTSFRHFAQNFCLGRALALQGGSFDARGKNIDVQISYGAPSENKLWNMWAAHIKSIIVKQNDVSVQV